MDFHYKKDSGFSLSQALTLEWLESNGLGGYASSTIPNCNTRKYHGLLVSSLLEPNGKFVLLAKLDDSLLLENGEQKTQVFSLASNLYPDVFFDGGYKYLREFIYDTHPQFIYDFGDIVVSKEILMPYNENTILVKYKLLKNISGSKVILRLRPLFAYRDFHALTSENNALQSEVVTLDKGYMIKPYHGMPESYLNLTGDASFTKESTWHKNICYEKEAQRGFASREDLFALGYFSLVLDGENAVVFSYSLNSDGEPLLDKWRAEIVRRMNFITRLTGSELQKQLKKIGFSFVTHVEQSKDLSLVAGYHWFLSWGRDAMIALPGICLYSGLEAEFLAVLQHFCEYEQDGLIPNFLGKTEEDHAYNSVDTSLWLVWAVQQYYLKTRNLRIIEQYFWPTLKSIFTNYRDGTLYDIKLGEDFLLYAGGNDNKLNLTWMDAVVNGVSATPRNGAQVEVNALWYNMLCFMRVLALQFRDPVEKDLADLIPKVRKAFRDNFWDERLGFLKDFINPQDLGNYLSFALRPNQIFAVSLPYSPLTQKVATKVIKVVQENLLTPFGLRTLSPQHPNYIGHYQGSSVERDRAYHNGTVWPWLLAHFAEAMLKITDKKKVVTTLAPCIEALTEHLKARAGVGTVAEIFSGDSPHEPNGCISQAWSVAELLRLTYLLGV